MRERENMGEGTKLWGPVTVISEFQSGFESYLNPKTADGVFSNLPWNPHKTQVRFQTSLKFDVPNKIFFSGIQ
jgi:hypothetical protein